ncbi:hypothetical protein EMCRGX_G023709 [Ephydatia muelleri]
MSRFRKQVAYELSIGALHPLKKADDVIEDVMEHQSVNKEDDDIESGSTSSLNSDTDSNDFLVPEYENPGPDADGLTALKWGREHYISYTLYLVGVQDDVGKRASMTLSQLSKFTVWPEIITAVTYG